MRVIAHGASATSARSLRPTAWIEAASNSHCHLIRTQPSFYREAGRRLIGPFKDSPEFLDRNREVT